VAPLFPPTHRTWDQPTPATELTAPAGARVGGSCARPSGVRVRRARLRRDAPCLAWTNNDRFHTRTSKPVAPACPGLV
jgi:hypothetical protein